MGQFKPMTKMMTTEPSVILKLKKGGKVEHKAAGGFMPMQSGMASTMPTGMPARGGSAPAAAPKKPSMAERRRAMNPNMLMKKGGKATCEKVEEELKEHEAKPVGKAHKKASGGIIMSKTGKTKMVTGDKHDSAKGTGGVTEGKPGGYATGGVINGKPAGYKNGGTTCWENKPANDGDKHDSAHGTTGVRLGNAGGYKKGGKAEAMCGGGMMAGGKASKKAYATGGKVDDGKAEAMPKKPVSRPVANNLQSGTFKKGGKVDRKAEGGLEDLSKGAYDKVVTQKPVGSGFASKVQGAIDKFFTAKKPATVTETKESVTTSKKNGGKC